MNNIVTQKWQSFVRFLEALDTGSSYPFEQIRELQLEVLKLKADGSVCAVCGEAEQRT